MRNTFLVMLALAAATPASAQDLRTQVQAKLAEAAPGTRFGLVVATEDGAEILTIDPEGRYIPASNTKMFSTAVTFSTTLDVNVPDTSGNAVRIDGQDVVLIGNGDARMSSAADCVLDCLSALADAVAAKTKRVRDVIGDDTLFPDQRWSPGMSWNNIPTRSGTGISALTLDDNEVGLTVTPSEPGKPAIVALESTYYTIDNRTTTVEGAVSKIGYDRLPFERVVRVMGTIGKDAKPDLSRMGIDDPAHYAAWRLKAMLEARGVKVKGAIRVLHRPLMPEDDPTVRKGSPAARTAETPVLARLTPAPLGEDLKQINKISQNLHAELALRRVARMQGSGSIADGIAEVEAMLGRAGVARTAWDLSDGSGMSSYNRVAPRGVVQMLRWISVQPWGTQWRDTLPIGGVDGTLKNRFKGTPLEGKVFAKTGTLNATNAISGYLTAASGKRLIFAFYANDIPADSSATKIMDSALNLIAATR